MIDILKIEFFDALNSEPATNLVGSIGSYVRAETTFYVHWEARNIPLTFSNSDRITWAGGDWFGSGFTLGDEIEIADSGVNNGTYTILEISEESIKVTPGVTPATNPNVNVYGVTPIVAANMKFGLPSNSDSDAYISKLDNISEQKYYALGLDASVTTPVKLLPYTGKLHWITGFGDDRDNTVIKGVGIGASNISTGREQVFKIEHIFYINPDYVTAQFKAGKLDFSLVDYLFDTESLRYAEFIECSKDGQVFDHNTTQGNIKQFLKEGNVGFYDENKNGGAPRFTAVCSLMDSVSGAVIDTLNTIKPTNFEIIISPINGASFTSGGNKAVVSLRQVVGTTVYQNSSNYNFENINFDRAIFLEAGGSIDGGGIEVSSIAVVSGSLKLTGVIYNQPWMTEGARYILTAETQSTGNTSLATTDKMTLRIKEDSARQFIDLNGVVSNVVKMLDHPYSLPDDGWTDYKGWIQDDIVLRNSIVHKNVNDSGETVQLLSARVDFEVIANDQVQFVLETGLTLVPGDDGTLNYQYGVGSEKNHYFLNPDPTLTTPTETAYDLQWPAKARYEDWLNQPNAVAGFSGTKNWSDYIDEPGFAIYAVVKQTYAVGVYSAVQEHRTIVTPYQFDRFKDCDVSCEIKTTDENLNDLGGLLSPTTKTLVQAIFTGDGLDCYDFATSEFWGILRWDIAGTGTVETIDEIGTEYVPKLDNKWISITGIPGDKADIVKDTGPNSVTVLAYLDTPNMSQNISDYRLSARLGRKPTPVVVSSGASVTSLNYSVYHGIGKNYANPQHKMVSTETFEPCTFPSIATRRKSSFTGKVINGAPGTYKDALLPILAPFIGIQNGNGNTYQYGESNYRQNIGYFAFTDQGPERFNLVKQKLDDGSFYCSNIIWISEGYNPGNAVMRQNASIDLQTTDIVISYAFAGFVTDTTFLGSIGANQFPPADINAFTAMFDLVTCKIWKGGTIKENPNYNDVAFEVIDGILHNTYVGFNGSTINYNQYGFSVNEPYTNFDAGTYWFEVQVSSSTLPWAKTSFIFRIEFQ